MTLMRWIIIGAVILLVGIMVKGQIDFNKLMVQANKSAGGL